MAVGYTHCAALSPACLEVAERERALWCDILQVARRCCWHFDANTCGVCEDHAVTTAELVLEYVKALTWPAVVVAATITFRRPISKKIERLKTLDAAGVETTFESEAEAVESKADAKAAQVEAANDEVAARLEATGDAEAPLETKQVGPGRAHHLTLDEPGWSESTRAVQEVLAKRATESLNEARNFDTARRLASVDPNAAVMAASRRFEQGIRAAYGLMDRQSDNRTQDTANILVALGLDEELQDLVRDIRRLRSAVALMVEDVTVNGAMAYIAATERAMAAVLGTVLSQLRPPSRSPER